MAISASNLTSGTDTGGTDTASTASISPTSNNLIIATVETRTTASATVTTPTCSGNGLTWVQIATIQWDNTATSYKRTTMFRALGSSPSSGSITFDCDGQNQTEFNWFVDEFSGVNLSGTNGSGAIVQSATNSNESPAPSTSITVTLNTFEDSGNATYGTLMREDETSSGSDSAGSGFNVLASFQAGTGNFDGASEWKNVEDTTVDYSFGGSAVQNAGIAVEIRQSAQSLGNKIYADSIL